MSYKCSCYIQPFGDFFFIFWVLFRRKRVPDRQIGIGPVLSILFFKMNDIWKLSKIYLIIFMVFSYIIIDHSCRNCCVYTKTSLIVCVINTHILIYQYARCDCKLWNAYATLLRFFRILHTIDEYSFLKYSTVSLPHKLCI